MFAVYKQPTLFTTIHDEHSVDEVHDDGKEKEGSTKPRDTHMMRPFHRVTPETFFFLASIEDTFQSIDHHPKRIQKLFLLPCRQTVFFPKSSLFNGLAGGIFR